MSGKNCYIKDACILIDLIELDLINCFYELNLKIITTDLVNSEISDPAQQKILQTFISKGLIQIDALGDFEIIRNLFNQCPGLSTADCSVIELALRIDGQILTSDGKLRKYAYQRKLIVSGVLWIIEELVNQNLMCVESALNKLKEYPRLNDRAPVKEISILVKKFKELSTINN